MKNKHYDCSLNRFTLVELLASLAIVGVLLGIALPAFQKLAKGQGVELAARTVGAKLKAARSYAITKREYVAVLFPLKHAGPTSSETEKDYVYPCEYNSGTPKPEVKGLPEKYYSHSYRVCVVSKGSSGYSFRRWIEGEKWNFLPEGTAIFEIDTDSTVQNNGTILTPENENDMTTITGPVNCSEIGGLTDATNFVGIVFQPNGRAPAAVPGNYIDIGEGKFTGGELVVTKKDLKGYISLKIDNITGRISYETP